MTDHRPPFSMATTNAVSPLPPPPYGPPVSPINAPAKCGSDAATRTDHTCNLTPLGKWRGAFHAFISLTIAARVCADAGRVLAEPPHPATPSAAASTATDIVTRHMI
jgi:hypothetical protein